MVLTPEPSLIYEGDYLMVAEENVLVTDHGVELLSHRVSRDLPIINKAF